MLPIPGIKFQIQQRIAGILASDAPNVVTAKLHWRTVNHPPGYDPNDETTLGTGTVATPHELEFRTFFHQVDHSLSGFQRFMEIQTGDVILDYLADLQLEGKADTRIEVNDVYYVQKSIGRELKEAWDVQLGLGGTLRTMLLTPAG